MRKILSSLWNIVEKIIHAIMQCILNLFHIEWEKCQWEKFMQFVKFCMVGLSSAIVMYISYFIAFMVTSDYMLANFVGFIFSTTNSFIWNNMFVFERQKGILTIFKSYLKTICVYSVTGLILSNILLLFWIDIVKLSEFVAPVINIVIVTPLNYVFNKLWAFSKHK